MTGPLALVVSDRPERVPTPDAPIGYRFMTPTEGDALTFGQAVTLWNGSAFQQFAIRGYSSSNGEFRVVNRAGHVMAIDVDHEDFWPWHETRERRSPRATEDGETWYAVVCCEARIV